jgi:hypothetical protein
MKCSASRIEFCCVANRHTDTHDRPSLPSASTTHDQVKSPTLSLELNFSPSTTKRQEEPTGVILTVYIWGLDKEGTKFVQKGTVSNISARTALLGDIKRHLECGDLIGISCNGRQARFRVIWTCHTNGKIAAAVQRLESDRCPWEDVLAGLSQELDQK